MLTDSEGQSRTSTSHSDSAAPCQVRPAGFTPTLSDAEVSTREIGGASFTLQPDKDLYTYLAQPPRPFFPQLSERRLFLRQAATRWQCTAAWQRRLTCVSGQAHDPVQPIDTLPLPVGPYPRAPRAHCCAGQADYGDCAAKNLQYSGFTLGLRLSRGGMSTPCPRLAARPHDRNPLAVLVKGFCGMAPADQGCSALHLQQHLVQAQGGCVVTPRKQRMTAALYPAPGVHTCARWRKVIATVGSPLTERCGVKRMRGHDLWPFQPRLIRKVLAHTVAVFWNLTLGRPPLALDGLVAS